MRFRWDNLVDPDETYELTTDNVMKMLAIHMRFRWDNLVDPDETYELTTDNVIKMLLYTWDSGETI